MALGGGDVEVMSRSATYDCSLSGAASAGCLVTENHVKYEHAGRHRYVMSQAGTGGK
jgi:hypothetical protein